MRTVHVDRRTVLGALGGTLVGVASGASPALSEAQRNLIESDNSIIKDQYAAEMNIRRDLLASFPYERLQTTAIEAFDLAETLKNKGRGYPIITGTDDDDIWQLAERIQSATRTPEQILAVAESIDFPGSLKGYFDELDLRMEKLIQGDDSNAKSKTYSDLRPTPPLGDWPNIDPESLKIPPSLAAALASHFQPEDPAQILLIPTDDSTAIPAYLNWGGWNRCPAPEYQVAGLRSWRSRYGAELISLRSDVLACRVARRPMTQEEALSLANEQYLYDEDLVLQNTQNFATLAAIRMSFDWWTFWWD